ncbi:MAG: sigma-70 family RNA polymerase sigma factor [Sedimentisphaerales bacterium]|nr:sigma-70 family RNA polymerase sigma factor [Sedimentisphaerales bacterium]
MIFRKPRITHQSNMTVMAQNEKQRPETGTGGGGADRHDGTELVKRFQAGHSEAFDEMVEAYRGKIAVLAHRLLGWDGDVEDVCQEVFVSALLGLKRFRGDCSLRTWLFRITINKCRSRQSRRLRLRWFGPAKMADAAIEGDPAEQSLIEAETAQAVRRAVQALPQRYREPVVLRYLQEMDHEQIAAVLGLSRTAVNVRLSRARQMLRQTLIRTSQQDIL